MNLLENLTERRFTKQGREKLILFSRRNFQVNGRFIHRPRKSLILFSIISNCFNFSWEKNGTIRLILFFWKNFASASFTSWYYHYYYYYLSLTERRQNVKTGAFTFLLAIFGYRECSSRVSRSLIHALHRHFYLVGHRCQKIYSSWGSDSKNRLKTLIRHTCLRR